MTKRSWTTLGLTALYLGIAGLSGFFSAPQAVLAQPAPIIVENVRILGGLYSFKIPRMEIRGANFSREDLLAVLAGTGAQPMSKRIAAMSFSEATMPELIQETDLAGDVSRTVYKDVKLTNAVNGSLGSVISSSAATESRSTVKNAASGKNETSVINGSFDKIAIENLDIAASVRAFGEVSDDAAVPMLRIYSAYSAQNFALAGTVPNGRLSLSVRRITGRDFEAKPGKTGFLDFVAIVKETPDVEDMDDEEKQKFFSSLLQFFTNIDFGSAQADDLSMSIDVDDAGKKPKPGEPTSIAFKMTSMRFGDADANLRLEGISMTLPKEKIELGLNSYEVKGFSLKPTLDRLKQMVDAGKFDEEDWKAVDPREFMPVFGSIAMKGLTVTGPEIVDALRLASHEVALGNQIKGVPTSFSYTIRDLAFSLPEKADDPQLAMLNDLGIRRLNLSVALTSNWDEASKEIRITEISAREDKLGSLRFSGVIGNVQKEFFSSSLSTVQILALAMTARSAELRIENGGIVDVVVKDRARISGKSEAEVRAAAIETLKRDLTSAVGDVPATRAVVEGAAKLLNGGRSLTIKVKARNELGLGMMDFIAAAKPAEVIEKVDVEVTSE